jgi:hypothetical protein
MPFIVTKPSGANPHKTCLLGHGETKDEAFEDAYGPKPWSPQQKKSAKSANYRQVNQDELNKILWD